jgi:DNA invertase Pin-like site-specific DNA recombinase
MTPAAYLRVSGTSQVDGGGFDRQLDACTRLAATLNLPSPTVYRENAISGTKGSDDRPAFQSMIAAMLDSGTKIVLIESLDRLAREYRVQEQLIIYLASKGLTLYTANTGENISEAMMGDPMRVAMVQMQGIFAQLDKSLTVAKLRKGRERIKRQTGRCEGRKAYGSLPGEAAILAEMRRLRASGMVYGQIAATLNAQGLQARSGGVWGMATVAKILGRADVLTTPQAAVCALACAA